jgi:hypothetical protein
MIGEPVGVVSRLMVPEQLGGATGTVPAVVATLVSVVPGPRTATPSFVAQAVSNSSSTATAPARTPNTEEGFIPDRRNTAADRCTSAAGHDAA